MTQEHTHEHAQPPDPMTEPCSRYFHGATELTQLLFFITQLAERLDEANKVLARVVLAFDEGQKDEERKRYKRMMEEGSGALKNLRAQRQLLFEMTYCRSVDNYLAYVSEIMALIFRTRPETLRSNETIKVDELLQHETMDDVVATLTERRVDELSYRGMRDLHGHLSDRLGFTLFQGDDKLETAASIIEVRNIIVHNRAVVNRRFLSRVPDPQPKLGERLELDADQVFHAVEFLVESCCDIDRRAASKFGLPQPISREQLDT